MSSAQGSGVFMAFAKQTVAFRTAAVYPTGFTFLPILPGGLKLARPSKASDELWGYEPRYMRAQNSNVDGTLPTLLYYSQIKTLLGNLLNVVSSTAQASYVVAASGPTQNDKIYFTRAGAHTATVANASYTTTTLATAIAAAMNAADAAQTYACTYSTTTKKFTITNGAAFVLTLSNATTAIWDLIGFTGGIDTSSATSQVAGTAAPEVYSTIYSPQLVGEFTNSQELGLSILQNMHLFDEEAVGCMVTGLTAAWQENDPHTPLLTWTVKGATLTQSTDLTPTFSTDLPATPQANVSLSLTLNNGNVHTAHAFKMLQCQITPSTDLRWKVGDNYPVKAIRTGKIAYGLNFTWDVEDDDTEDGGGTANLGDDHNTVWNTEAGTAAATLVQTGELLRGSYDESLTIALPALRPTGDTPQAQQGTLERPYVYQGEWDGTNGSDGLTGLTITVVSTEV